MTDVKHCTLCPRACGADRTKEYGFCGGSAHVKIARAALHQWEEPCISGGRGSGTVFFSGCPLKCCFCQNYPITAENFGKEISIERLAEIFLELQAAGAHNINLVNPVHFAPQILEALELVTSTLQIPIVYNSGGYETLETLRMLAGKVDIYLPDLKYVSSDRSARYSGASDYFSVAAQAILEMFRQAGPIQLNKQGVLQKGLIVRHLVMPKGHLDSIAVLDWLAQNLPINSFYLSLMSQFTPFYRCTEYPEINRRISTFEYNRVLDYACKLGFQGFMQEKSSAKEEYTPTFDLEGV